MTERVSTQTRQVNRGLLVGPSESKKEGVPELGKLKTPGTSERIPGKPAETRLSRGEGREEPIWDRKERKDHEPSAGLLLRGKGENI